MGKKQTKTETNKQTKKLFKRETLFHELFQPKQNHTFKSKFFCGGEVKLPMSPRCQDSVNSCNGVLLIHLAKANLSSLSEAASISWWTRLVTVSRTCICGASHNYHPLLVCKMQFLTPYNFVRCNPVVLDFLCEGGVQRNVDGD